MQQRQLRLGDILDDYCPRERRVTNHAVVAMIGDDVKQTRCTTCDAEHEYKHAKVPRQRRKSETPAALYAQVAASAPKKVSHDHGANGTDSESVAPAAAASATEEHAPTVHVAPVAEAEPEPPVIQAAAPREEAVEREVAAADGDAIATDTDAIDESAIPDDEGPIHRRLIRASLPRPEGQQPPARPIPEFTIRQPGGRPNRFRGRQHRGGNPQQFFGNRSNGNSGGMMRGPRPNNGRPGMMNRRGQGGGGRKRSK